MAEHSIEKEFVYHGFGFPVTLRDVPLIKLRNTWTPDINLNVLQKAVLLALVYHSAHLTGNQVRFIRLSHGLTQTEFGKLFGITHPAVVKWEKAGNRQAKMILSTQRDMRLWLLDQLLTNDESFRKGFKIIHKATYESSSSPIKVDVPTDLLAS